jgi:hypothetical protein
MSEAFDPYHKWLGIPKSEQPPNHYRLLGLVAFESDPDVIQSAAVRQTAHVRNFARGEHSELSQRVLNELAAAQLCLLQQERKAAYDQVLRAKLAPPAPLPAAAAPSKPSAIVPDRAARRHVESPRANAIDSILADAAAVAPPLPALPRTHGAKASRASRRIWLLLPGIAVAVAVFWLVSTFVTARLEALLNVGPAPNAAQPPEGAPPPAPADETGPVKTAGDGGAIDLLKTIDLPRDARGGSWRLDGGVLISAAGQRSIVDLRSTPSKSYRLTLVVERTLGEESLMVGLKVGAQRVSALVDGYATLGFRSGLQLVDHQLLNANATAARGRLLTNGRRHAIVWTVQPGTVTLQVDGREAFRCAGDFQRLLPDGDWWNHGAQGLVLGSWHCEYRISQIELLPLPD